MCQPSLFYVCYVHPLSFSASMWNRNITLPNKYLRHSLRGSVISLCNHSMPWRCQNSGARFLEPA